MTVLNAMKLISLICSLFFVAGLRPVHGQWGISYDEEHAYLGYRWNAGDKKHPSVEGLAEVLANRKKELPLKHVSFFTYFLNDPIIQAELQKEYQSKHPALLADALKSSGNLHNPKVAPLRSKFSECLLQTPTVVKINELLSASGYTVKKAEHEKFFINKEKEVPKFYAVVWLILEAKADQKSQPPTTQRD